MKFFTALAALTLIAAPAQAFNVDGAAAAYCGARTQGAPHKKAVDAAISVIAAGTAGGSHGMAQAIMHGKALVQAAGFRASQMCPDLYHGQQESTQSTQSILDLPAVSPVWQ